MIEAGVVDWSGALEQRCGLREPCINWNVRAGKAPCTLRIAGEMITLVDFFSPHSRRSRLARDVARLALKRPQHDIWHRKDGPA